MKIEQINLSTLGKNIIKTILYFDVFQYPLTIKEIIQTCGTPNCSIAEVEKELKYLIEESVIFYHSGFYSIQNNESLVGRRVMANELAKQYIVKAKLITKFISQIPYVRGIFLSGSISKNYADENSDVDYFVITEKQRIWIVRSMFFLFQKIFLLNSRKYFCFNYLLDLSNLEIKDKTYYTAIETSTLIPVYGRDIYLQFMKSNQWIQSYFPNFPLRPLHDVPPQRVKGVKYLSEFILNNKVGNYLETKLKKLTILWWKRRVGKHDVWDERFYISAQPNAVKMHLINHYPRILQAFQQKIDKFEKQHQISIS